MHSEYEYAVLTDNVSMFDQLLEKYRRILFENDFYYNLFTIAVKNNSINVYKKILSVVPIDKILNHILTEDCNQKEYLDFIINDNQSYVYQISKMNYVPRTDIMFEYMFNLFNKIECRYLSSNYFSQLFVIYMKENNSYFIDKYLDKTLIHAMRIAIERNFALAIEFIDIEQIKQQIYHIALDKYTTSVHITTIYNKFGMSEHIINIIDMLGDDRYFSNVMQLVEEKQINDKMIIDLYTYRPFCNKSSDIQESSAEDSEDSDEEETKKTNKPLIGHSFKELKHESNEDKLLSALIKRESVELINYFNEIIDFTNVQFHMYDLLYNENSEFELYVLEKLRTDHGYKVSDFTFLLLAEYFSMRNSIAQLSHYLPASMSQHELKEYMLYAYSHANKLKTCTDLYSYWNIKPTINCLKTRLSIGYVEDVNYDNTIYEYGAILTWMRTFVEIDSFTANSIFTKLLSFYINNQVDVIKFFIKEYSHLLKKNITTYTYMIDDQCLHGNIINFDEISEILHTNGFTVKWLKQHVSSGKRKNNLQNYLGESYDTEIESIAKKMTL